MVFEGPPGGIRLGSRGPLRAGEGLAQGHTVKSPIFALCEYCLVLALALKSVTHGARIEKP